MPNVPQQVGKWWILTLSCADYPDTPALAADAVYAKGQQERGAGGFLHWQIVVCFQANKRRSGVVERYPGAHAELTRSPAALAYVWKEDTRVEGSQFEHGTPPFKRNSKTDWDAVWEAAKNGDLDAIPAQVKCQNWNNIRSIRAEHAQPTMRPVPVVHVFWGVTGSGKSHRAFEEAGVNPFVKSASNKWWDGYRGQDAVVIDEFAGMVDITHLLRWFDKYPYFVEIKGSTTPLKAHKFWVTSNIHPENWYPNAPQEQKAALLRRINITHFERQWVPLA